MIGPMFVLIVMQGWGTHHMFFQEFNTKDRCEYAKSLFINDKSIALATCVPK